MGKPQTSPQVVDRIRELRRTGHSIPEIRQIVGVASTTIHRYIQSVEVLPEYRSLLKSKQGGRKVASLRAWEAARKRAAETLSKDFSKRDYLLLLAALYWGEGNKRELSLINSDPDMVKTFIMCLKVIGVDSSKIRVSVRIYSDINEAQAKNFWATITGVNLKNIYQSEVIQGKKTGKLKYGMCRVRVEKGASDFKLIMSVIELLKAKFATPS